MSIENLVAWLPFDTSTTEDYFNNVWTPHGDVSLSTEITKFGGASVHLPSGAYLTADNIIDLNADKWTLSYWCYRVTSSGDEGYIGLGEGSNRHGIIAGSDGVYVATANGGSWQAKHTSLGFPNVSEQWVHLEIDKDGTSLKFFRDGVLVWTATIGTLNDTGLFILGGNSYGYTNDLYFDEVQFYEGVALHSEDFTPPTEDDYVADKLLLESTGFHFRNKVDIERVVVNASKQFEVQNDLKMFTYYFDAPPMLEMYLYFRVYFDGSNRWRAYNGGTNGSTGITAQTSGDLSFFSNGTKVQQPTGICIKNQFQDIRLHMVSDSSVGVIEAWVDDELVYSYRGNVNNGQPFEEIYLQSDGKGTFHSRVYLANFKPDFVFFDGVFDITRDVRNQAYVAQTIAQDDLTIWLPFLHSPTEDLCDNPWQSNSATMGIEALHGKPLSGAPSDVALRLDPNCDVDGGQLTLDCQGVYLGGKDFSITFKWWYGGTLPFSGNNIIFFADTSGEGFSLHLRERFSADWELLSLRAFGQATEEYGGTYRTWWKIKIAYSHTESALRWWLNDKLRGELNVTIPRTLFTQVRINDAVTIEHESGYISDFKLTGGEMASDCAKRIYIDVFHNGSIQSYPFRAYEVVGQLALAIRYDERDWYNILRDPQDSLASDFYILHDNDIYALSKG